MTKERDIENLLEQQLSNLGFIIEYGNPEKQVFMQSPRTIEEKEKLKGLEPDFCIYFNKNNNYPNIIIETKKPNMDLKKTYYQALNYAQILNSDFFIIYDGHTLKTFYTKTEEELCINGEIVKNLLSIEQYQLFISKDSSALQTIKQEIKTRQELIKVFSFANNKLRKSGIQKGLERFTEFSNLLFLKLISEDNNLISESIPEHIKWEAYRNKSGDELFSYINNIVIPELERVFNKTNQESLFTPLLIKDTLALKQIITKLDELELTQIDTDIKGDAFEYFIQKYNSSNKDLGEYFTPRHIVNFIVDIADIQYGEKVYDPFCGTGGLLISAFSKLKTQLLQKSMLLESTLKELKENTIYGSEISSTARIAKMNMILTGDGHSNILHQDTLKNKMVEQYDVVISNIPFNLEVDESSLYYTKNSKNGNVQSLEHIIYSLKKNGKSRAVVIVPEGVLNNSELLNTRKFLVDNNLLLGIISLPSGVFLPYADAKTSILILQGFNGPKKQDCFFYKVTNDGFTLTSRRRKKNGINDLEEFCSIDQNSLPKISYKDIQQDPNYSLLYFKYDTFISSNRESLSNIIRKISNKNSEEYPTITISNKEFYGVVLGSEYWGENFDSVTSETNIDYKVICKNQIAYNPSRANIGSIGINITNEIYAVSKMYVTFEVYNPEYIPEYIYLYLKSPEGIEEIKTRSFGAVRQALRFEDLIKITIPKISIEEQKKICSSAYEKYECYIKAKSELNSFELFK